MSDDMPEGRELDRLVAEKVMGWKAEVDKHGEWRVVDGDGRRMTRRDTLAVSYDPRTGERQENPWSAACDVPAYSSDMADAWLVVERMFPREFKLIWSAGHSVWLANFNYQSMNAVAATAPLSICRAALMALDKA